MKSIRKKILLCMSLVVLISLSLVGGISSMMNYKSTVGTLEATLSQSVVIAANQVAGILDGYKKLVLEITSNPTLLSETAAEADKLAELNALEQRLGFVSVDVANQKGFFLESRKNVSDSEYFTACKETGEVFITDPVLDEDSNQLLIYLAAPVMKNGSFDGVVVAAVKGSFLSEIASSIKVGSGNAAILNKQGDTIGFADQQLVIDKYNTQKEAKSDPKLDRLAEIEANMCAGITGFAGYYYGGVEKMMAYCPIPNTNGWSIDIAIVRDEFMDSTTDSIKITCVLMAVAFAAAVVVAVYLANMIADPIKASAERLAKLAEGDLNSAVPTVKTKDELSILSAALTNTISSMNSYISDVRQGLGLMAGGDMNIAFTVDFKGDFIALKDSMEIIANSFSKTLEQINESAEQVSAGSDQIAAGAQALSQGATEQASSVEELSATISELAVQVKQSADFAEEARERTASAGNEVLESNKQMQILMDAMQNIGGFSGEIGKIIKTIEDIAFQTNILALNAAIEAARAGEAGKGFAVVADEVRNLAAKSGEAAKDTTALIEDSIRAIENGTEIAGKTATSLALVVDGAKLVEETVDMISKASHEQAESLEQINIGMDQISGVVQTNSATAEESAAASEELAEQAQGLRDLVNLFRVRRK